MSGRRVCLDDLAAELKRVKAELPGVTDEHLVRAEELIQAMFVLDNGQTPEFVERPAATDAVIVFACAQFALRHCLDRVNLALVTGGGRR